LNSRFFYSGKTSLFNLLSNSDQPLGNSVSSTTKEFFYKTSGTNTFIDTIGFRDTEDENEHKLKVVLLLKEIRNGFDISMSYKNKKKHIALPHFSFLLYPHGCLHI
jgi:predicted GTPase